MLGLARRAMAELAVERLLPAELELNLAAVAVGFVLCVEMLVLLVHAVRRARLPLADARSLIAAALGVVFAHSGAYGKGSCVVGKVRSGETCAWEC